MKKSFILLTLLLTTAALQLSFGQASLELQVVGLAGNVSESSGGASLHYTVGEMAITEMQNGTTLSQGFHQILVEKLVLSTHTNEITANVEVFPNPTKDFLHLKTDTPLEATLYDLQGRQILQTVSTETSTVIDLSTLPTGNYLLRSTGPTGQMIKAFKVQIIR